MIRGPGIWVPRWLIFLALIILVFWFAARIFVPPMWVVQQLDAPDGTRSARLLRSVYIRHHFVVKLKDGWTWQTAFYSPPLTNDFSVDLGERLRWTEDSSQVWLRMEGQPVWGYDFVRRRSLYENELKQLAVP